MHAGDCDSLHLPLRWYGGCIIFDSVVGELVSSPHTTKELPDMNKNEERPVAFGYDHTMGNTPDPIRTPKLSPIGPG